MSFLQGHLLVAMPLLNDGNFKRSVIFLAEHNEQGSLGFIVNKPMFLTLKDVVRNADGLKLPVYGGGPVATNQLFYVHTVKGISESIHIQQNYYWSGNFAEILEGLKNKTIRPNQIRFFIGYAGWGTNQLQDEINEKAWGVLDSYTTEFLDKHPDDIWPQQVARLGPNYKVFGDLPAEPSLN